MRHDISLIFYLFLLLFLFIYLLIYQSGDRQRPPSPLLHLCGQHQCHRAEQVSSLCSAFGGLHHYLWWTVCQPGHRQASRLRPGPAGRPDLQAGIRESRWGEIFRRLVWWENLGGWKPGGRLLLPQRQRNWWEVQRLDWGQSSRVEGQSEGTGLWPDAAAVRVVIRGVSGRPLERPSAQPGTSAELTQTRASPGQPAAATWHQDPGGPAGLEASEWTGPVSANQQTCRWTITTCTEPFKLIVPKMTRVYSIWGLKEQFTQKGNFSHHLLTSSTDFLPLMHSRACATASDNECPEA